MTAENRIAVAADVEDQKGTVRKATADDVPRLAKALARAFYDDPAMEWFFPDDSQRMRRRELMFESFFLKRVCLPHDETYTTEDLVGGALWMPPGKWQLGLMDNLRLLLYMAAACGRHLPRALRGSVYLDSKHPHERHYYLLILGVEPGWQGKGIGTALMQPILERCDRETLPAYRQAPGAHRSLRGGRRRHRLGELRPRKRSAGGGARRRPQRRRHQHG
jgi:GNAT superfamily N-acetyltransferase